MKRIISGERLARKVVEHLFNRSAHFELLPLPCDKWEVSFKEEHETSVDEVIHIHSEACPIDNDRLKSIGFKHMKGAHNLMLEYRASKWIIETPPEFIDREGDRKWHARRKGSYMRCPLFPPPRNMAEVHVIVERLKDET